MILIPSWRVHQIRMLLKYLYFGFFACFFVCWLVGFVRLFGSCTRDMLHGFYSGKSNRNDSSVPKKNDKLCFISSDHFADELPCFSVDELWNDDELSLILNDDSDSFASPPEQNSWERVNNSSQSRHFTAAERHQSNSNVKSQELKSKTSDKVNKQPLLRSQFITRPKAKVANNTSFSVGHMYSQPKENSRRVSHPLPPPPPTPGADDFEMTGLGRSARSAYNENWNEEQFKHGTTKRIARRQNWSTLTHDPLPDGLEKEDWDVLPVFTKPRQRRNSSSSDQQSSKNLQSMLSSTTLEPLVIKETICIEESDPMIDEDFSTNRCEQR